jgi:AbrB family looped-hinge helix DNA binding protein
MGSDWYDIPMEAVVDQAGRIVLPKYIRDALGLLPGTKVDIGPHAWLRKMVPSCRPATRQSMTTSSLALSTRAAGDRRGRYELGVDVILVA